MPLRSTIRGVIGEIVNRACGWLLLSNREYHSFHNIVIPSDYGTAEIDHVIVSRFGVFVIETKSWSGWLFASARDKTWTRVLFRGRTQVRNPLHQNYGHAMALSKLLDVPSSSVRSVVAIRGAEFKTPVPDGVVVGGYAREVRRHREPVLAEPEVARVLGILRSDRVARGWLARIRHMRRTRERFKESNDGR